MRFYCLFGWLFGFLVLVFVFVVVVFYKIHADILEPNLVAAVARKEGDVPWLSYTVAGSTE